MKGESAEELNHWQPLHLVASQFQRAFTPDAFLSIVGEGREAVNFLKDVQANGDPFAKLSSSCVQS